MTTIDYQKRADLMDSLLIEKLKRELESAVEGRCLVDESLSKHTSFRAGGPAKLYVFPATVEALTSLVEFCWEKQLQTFIIGFGTNLLVSEAGFAGCIIDLSDCGKTLLIKGNEMIAGSAVWLNDAIEIAAEHCLRGMEKLAGIPGGVGGGLSMNCGAFGMSISDHLATVNVMNSDGCLQTLSRADIGFQYRSAPGLAGKIVLEATFVLPRGNRTEIIHIIEETITDRFRRNVMTLPSAGSVFKNPQGNFAAKLLESVGAKGLTEGGVEVSPHHANFIVNARGGSATDIVSLIRRLRGMVEEQHGIKLELEVRTLGFEDEPVLN
jgi:UDP-N-acetylmuramate dehydrogenase